MFSKLLVANRGEIAARIVRTCADLGVTSVAIHSDADAGALHVRLADESVHLDGTSADQTYLNIDRIIAAAKETGAEAIHPGYGFLAENARFAAAVTDAGLVFIGPPASAIESMGEKVAARKVAQSASVPGVPGTVEFVQGVSEVVAFGAEHGYPIAIKAAYGGGGRGMRILHSEEEAAQGLESAAREAASAFGHPEVYLERFLSQSRHVEVQVFADQHGHTVYLGDRDCSIQRRNQKVVEEAPAPGLSDDLRREMGEAAVRLAEAVDYVGAGTVEYLVEGDKFYFLEMNTRIQVEHPVTEATLGMDLIAEQIRVAAGEPLSVTESGPAPRGHAIECRINAENIAGGLFIPSPGPVETLEIPERPGVRFDGGYVAGDVIPSAYDSMIGKLIVWGPDRPTAIRRMVATLDDVRISGVPTSVDAGKLVVGHEDFANVDFHTRWLETSVTFPEAEPVQPGEDEEDDSRSVVWVAGRRYVIPFHGERPVVAIPPESADGPRKRPRGSSRRGPGRRGGAGDSSIVSPMVGTVLSVKVSAGQQVQSGDVLFVVEAMKMENPVRSPRDGEIAEVLVAEGDNVESGKTLANLKPDEAGS